jgi:hypothetical protein
MNSKPLTSVLIKIFANGFYRVHAGFFLFVVLVMAGSVPPERLWVYEKTLMLAFISSPMMAVVFAVWLLYALKAIHYVTGQILAVNQQFLFYSSNSLSKWAQFICWAGLQIAVLAPVIGYGLIAVGVAIAYHYYAAAMAIMGCLAVLTAAGTGLYMLFVNRLRDGSRQSLLLKMSGQWPKPFFSLYIYQVFNSMKVAYIFTKMLSWLIITSVFYLFADVNHDVRVAGIAALAMVTAHVILIYQQHIFYQKWLAFARNLPFTRATLFRNFCMVYFLLLLPEGIWLFSRFSPFLAFGLLAGAISMAMLFHTLLYALKLDMEKYLQWVLGLFVVVFWLILYQLFWMLIVVNLLISAALFYRNYYGEKGEIVGD